MLTKILLTLVLAMAAWMVISRLQGGRGKSARRERPRIFMQQTKKCGQCGIYLPAGQACGCTDRA